MSATFDEMQEKTKNRGLSLIFLTYIHPNLGALTAASAGILRLPFKKFLAYSLAALILWNSLWGLLAYFAGPQLLEYIGPQLILAVLLIWILVLAVEYMVNRNKNKNTNA